MFIYPIVPRFTHNVLMNETFCTLVLYCQSNNHFELIYDVVILFNIFTHIDLVFTHIR